MKKTIVSSLVLSMIPGLCLGVNDRIYKLMQEKQEKMEKLEKCQGTTKNLKIAGLSTLGITAVGVGTNIAEAVVLNDYKSDVAKAKDARDAQLKIKNERVKAEQEAAQRLNTVVSDGPNQPSQEESKYVVKIDFRNESLSYTDAVEKVMQWGAANEQSFSDCGYRHANDSDYIVCNNKDSKKWMFKFNAISDKNADVKGVQLVTINKTTLPYEEALDDINAWAANNKAEVFACSQSAKDKIKCGGETVDYEFTFGMGGGTITTDGTKYTSQSICQKHCSGLCLEERDSTGRWDCTKWVNNWDKENAKKAEDAKKVAAAIDSLGKSITIPVNGTFQLIDAEKYVKNYGIEHGISLSDCLDYNNDDYIMCDGPADKTYTFQFDKIMRDNKTEVIHQPDNRTVDQILKDNGYDAADALVPELQKELEEEEAQKKAEQDQAVKDFTDAQAKRQAASAEFEQMKNNANGQENTKSSSSLSGVNAYEELDANGKLLASVGSDGTTSVDRQNIGNAFDKECRHSEQDVMNVVRELNSINDITHRTSEIASVNQEWRYKPCFIQYGYVIDWNEVLIKKK